jgi:uncharacterized protein YjbJ (UPF0337 family)
MNAGQCWRVIEDRQFHKDMTLLTTRHDTAQPHEANAWRFASVKERSTAMSGKTDQIKGRIKEAAGVLTDNDRLKRKGKLDQVVGKVKETAEKAVDKMKESLTSNRPRGRAK